MIAETGSISAAGRAMNMSYRRAWLLLDDLNNTFREPVATTMLGGRAGGGATLTQFGKRLVEGYRRMETDAEQAVADYLAMVEKSRIAKRPAPHAARKAAK
jgi:molybdate transport system regulatory protein